MIANNTTIHIDFHHKKALLSNSNDIKMDTYFSLCETVLQWFLVWKAN